MPAEPILDSVGFTLKPVPPFRLDLTAWALRRRTENIIDRWDGNCYRRVLVAQQNPVEVEVVQKGPPDTPLLEVTVTGTAGLSSETGTAVQSALARMLGIDADLSEFYRFAEGQPKLDALARRFRGVKPPRFPTVFEALVNAIACQQLSLTVGIRILGRLAAAFGPSAGAKGVPVHGFPAPLDLSCLENDALKALGFSRQKASAVIELASAVSRKELDLDGLEGLAGDEEVVGRLRQLRGIGRWSAEYVLLRGLGRLHVFPGDDVGARTRLQRWLNMAAPLDYENVRHSISPWRAYGGLIYFHLLLQGLAEAGVL